jgi:predicted permease
VLVAARRALRRLSREPGFALLVLLTLAVGVGANTAIFSLVDQQLLRPLPYPEPQRLVAVYSRFLPASGLDFPRFPLSGPEFLDYQEQTRRLAGVAAYQLAGFNFTPPDGRPERVDAVAATAGLFEVLAVQPVLGRGFLPSEDQPGARCVAVLSHGLWRGSFGGDPGVVGREVRLDGEPCEVVGVMGEAFFFPSAQARLWRPLTLDPTAASWGRANHGFLAVGRLAPAAGMAEAEAEMGLLMERWAREEPHYANGHFLILRSLTRDLAGDLRPRLLLLLGSAGTLLLVMCINLASLFLARGEAASGALAVRAALGASRGRLVGLLCGECLLLASAGSVLGLLLAAGLRRRLLALYPADLPRLAGTGLDLQAFLFAAAAASLAVVVVGLLPALQATGARLQQARRRRGRSTFGDRRGARLRGALVVAQVMLGLVLLSSAGLLARSYRELRRVDLGFAAEGVLTLSLELPPAAYRETERVRALYAALLERVRELPGVESAGAISSLPLWAGAAPADSFLIEGRPEPESGSQWPTAGFVMVTPGAFEALRMPLRGGRSFTPGDRRDAGWVAVVNQETARRYWPGEDPIGRRIRYPFSAPEAPPRWIEIVGVVASARHESPWEPAAPAIYVPLAQTPRDPPYSGRFMTLAVRAGGAAPGLAPAIQAVVRELDPGLPVIQPQTMPEVVARALGEPRFTSVLAGAFALTALLMGALGLYGLLAYTVRQRLREYGLRLALGARGADVQRLVLRRGMGLVAAGLALGLPAALVLGRLLEGILYGVGPADPATYLGVCGVLTAAAALACALPARRAAAVDPLVTLREE